MKTKSNNWKTALKSLGAATGLALIGLTVNAQMSPYFENAGNSTMAMVTEKTMKSAFATRVNTKTLAKADVFAFYLTNEIEEPLHVEKWMLNKNKFEVTVKTKVAPKETKKVIVGANYTFVEETDNVKLQVEAWMVNPTVWKTK